MQPNTISVPWTRTTIMDVALGDSVRRYTVKAKAENTKRAYRSDLFHFADFCAGRNFSAFPSSPEIIACYLAAMADDRFRPATMCRRLAAISKAHSAANLDNPTSLRFAVVSETLAGIKRVVGTAQTQKAAATIDYLKRMLPQVPVTLPAVRDRALLLLGFAAALRRSELAALAVEDIKFAPEGLVVTIRASKT